jgi:hypothetical protein
MINDLTSYALAGMADALCPDAQDSPGAQFLEGVRDAVAEAIEYGQDSDDARHEIADGAVPIYTHERWLTFVDLGAYFEDLDELGGPSGDMTQDAAAALYLIASRLVAALYEAYADDDEGDDDEGDDDE